MDYITQPIVEGYNYELSDELQKVSDKILQLLPKTEQNYLSGWGMNRPQRDFVELMNTLERLFFLPDKDAVDTNPTKTHKNVMLEDQESSFKRAVEDETITTGFVFIKAAKSRYTTIPETRRLEVMERVLQEYPSQFIRIFTKNNLFCVYMNKQPTWKQVIRMKLMQWTIFKDIIDTPEPHIEKFLNGMLNDDLNTINNALDAIMNRSDFIELRYKEIMKVFKRGSENQLIDIRNKVVQKQNTIEDYKNMLSQLYTELKDLNIRLVAYESQEDPELEPLMKYLIKHPYIKEFELQGDDQIIFYYEAPIIYFDKYILEKVENRKSGTEKKILHIFAKNEFELITRCKIGFYTTSFTVNFYRIGAKRVSGSPRIIGHPHIDRYHCFGTHKTAVHEAAKTNNYFGAIEQISQGVLNLNFSDAVVIDEMLRTLQDRITYRTWRLKGTEEMYSTEEVLKHYEETQTE